MVDGHDINDYSNEWVEVMVIKMICGALIFQREREMDIKRDLRDRERTIENLKGQGKEIKVPNKGDT